MRKVINSIKGNLKLLLFLLLIDKASRSITPWITSTLISICVGLWVFPLSNLSRTGMLLPETQLIIRTIGTEIIVAIWLSLLVRIAFNRYKKYKNIPGLSNEELKNLSKYI